MIKFQNIMLRLMMNLPKFIQLKLSKRSQIELQGRKLSSAIQLMLSFNENVPDIDYSSIEAKDFREMYDVPNPMSFYSKKSEKIVTKDHDISVDNGSIKVREYLIEEASDSSLLYFHGGGFTSGNLESHNNLCKYLGYLLGMKVFSVDYRRSPEFKFPIPLHDCNYAFQWLIDNSKNFRLDPSRLYMGGDSAGGNLSAAVSLRRRDEGLILPHAQLLLYPVTDLRFLTESYKLLGKGYLLTENMMRWFSNNYINNSEEILNESVSPLLAEDFTGLPSSVVVTAGFDPLRDEGFQYSNRLKLAGVDSVYREQEGLIHAFAQFGIIPECRSAIKSACNDLLSL